MTIAQGQEPPGLGGSAGTGPDGTPGEGHGSGMGGGLVPGHYPPPESLRPTLVGDRWSVVGGHHLVSQAAADILARGGNAIDAGVAAGLASNVVQVDMCNLGGIAPILVRAAGEGSVHSVAGVGPWGARASRAEIHARFGGRLPLGGVPSIVPGAASAWITALARFGTMTFAEVAAPAIELALGGFPLDRRAAESLTFASASFRQWPSSAQVYWRWGRAPREGDRLVQADLGRLLQAMADAERGDDRRERLRAVHDHFYRGPVARTIADFVTEHGGYLDESDLASFQAEVGPAPRQSFRGWDVHVTPLWTQGLIVAQALAVLEPYDLGRLGRNSADYLHLVVEAMKVAFSDREEHYGDPAFAAVGADQLLAPEHIDRLRALITDQALPPSSARGLISPVLPSTTAVTVVDAQGNAFSTAPSDTLDGAPVIPGLGIICSPRGVQSRLLAGHPNELAPGQRPCVTPSAVIALRPAPTADRGAGSAPDAAGDLDVWAMACPGGDVIVQAMLQTLLNVTEFGLTLQEAVEAPRVAGFSFPSAFHPHPSAERLVYVEGRVDEAARAGLTARGHDLHDWPGYEFDAGSVQTSSLEHAPEGPVVRGAADPRRSAYALVR